MTSPIEQLPVETIKHIVSYVPMRSGLLSLSLASKRLHEVTAAVLFQSFHSGDTCAPVRRFTRALCSRRELSEHVRKLDLSLHPEKPCTALTSYDYALFSRALEQGMEKGPLLERALSALKRGCHAAEMLAICCMTTKVRTLRIALAPGYANLECSPVCPECPIFGESVRSIVYRGHENLKDVTLNGVFSMSNRHMMHKEIFGFLDLKQLHTLNCWNMVLPTKKQKVANAPRSSNVRYLNVRGSIRADAVYAMLRSCKSLVSFIFALGWSATLLDATISWNVIDTAWCEGLYGHRSSLEVLDFTNNAKIGFAGHQALGGLIDFEVLNQLTIDEALLVGKSGWQHANMETILPSSISKLKIRSYRELAEIGNILMAFRGWRPVSFASLTITFSAEEDGLNHQHLYSWAEFDDGEYDYSYGHHQKDGFEGTVFVVSGGPGCGDQLRIIFKCTETEVLENLAKFGEQLEGEDGLAQFVDAAREEEEVSLWYGGPIRWAQAMFHDEAMYEDDTDYDEE